MRRIIFAAAACASACTMAAVGLTAFSSTAGPLSAAAARTTVSQRAQARAALERMLKNNHAPMLADSSHSTETRTLGSGAAAHPRGTITTINWSGYGLGKEPFATPGTTDFTYVAGTWTVPAVTCNTKEARFDSNWVGIDGFNDTTVEQLGTSSECWEGKAYYTSWIEMFPGPSYPEALSVKPGQSITASVRRTGTKYDLYLKDNTTGASFNVDTDETTCAATTCLAASAEWVVERPAFASGFGFQIVPLAPYGTSTFTSMVASAAGLGIYTKSPATFVKGTGVWRMWIGSSATDAYPLDSTSSIKNNSFTTTWLNSY